MKALLFEEVRKPLEVVTIEDPKITDNGIVLEVKACGICRSDWHGWVGDAPVDGKPWILGHEFAGIIKEVGKNVSRFKVGDRVIVPVCQSDHSCQYCLNGHQNLCENTLVPGFRYWGGLAEYAHIPNADQNLIHLPDNLEFEIGAAMGCRFVTAYHGVVDQVKVRAGEWVAVFGAGGLGSSVIQIASAIGARVIAVDIGEAQLEMAKKLGARYVINSANENPVEVIKEITKGGANVSVDALGIVPTIQNAILSLTKRGRHLQLGVPNADNMFTAVPIMKIFNQELEIIGSNGMPISQYAAMLDLVESSGMDLQKLITRRISLGEVNGIFEEMDQFKSTGMVVVTDFSK